MAIFIGLSFIFAVRRLDPSFRVPGPRRNLPTEQPAPFKDPQEDPA